MDRGELQDERDRAVEAAERAEARVGGLRDALELTVPYLPTGYMKGSPLDRLHSQIKRLLRPDTDTVGGGEDD